MSFNIHLFIGEPFNYCVFEDMQFLSILVIAIVIFFSHNRFNEIGSNAGAYFLFLFWISIETVNIISRVAINYFDTIFISDPYKFSYSTYVTGFISALFLSYILTFFKRFEFNNIKI